jgi:hypothetical protein
MAVGPLRARRPASASGTTVQSAWPAVGPCSRQRRFGKALRCVLPLLPEGHARVVASAKGRRIGRSSSLTPPSSITPRTCAIAGARSPRSSPRPACPPHQPLPPPAAAALRPPSPPVTAPQQSPTVQPSLKFGRTSGRQCRISSVLSARARGHAPTPQGRRLVGSRGSSRSPSRRHAAMFFTGGWVVSGDIGGYSSGPTRTGR